MGLPTVRKCVCHPPIGAGLVVILMLIVAGLLNHKAEGQRAYQPASKYNQNPQQVVPPAYKSALVSEVTIAEPHPTREEWRQERDLEAQRDMARWAWWMIVVTAGGVVVTGFGVVFVRQTLVATRDMLAAAAETNLTAREAVSVTRQIGKKQVRAYLVCEGGEYTVDWQSISFRPKIKNVGQSPASEIILNAGLVHKRADGKFGRISRKGHPRGTAATGRYADSFVLWLWEELGTFDDFETVWTKGGQIALDCEMRWRDVFGDWQKATFSLDGEEGTVIGEKQSAVRAGSMRVYNHSTQDCNMDDGAGQNA